MTQGYSIIALSTMVGIEDPLGRIEYLLRISFLQTILMTFTSMRPQQAHKVRNTL